ncbi:hypothetical protein C8Q74DRAFT_1366336 [Fomes fomentarius]|nr:hypothetical protein C8Q74DRAFT_1366336 [Fomes fomentarius]
MHDGMIITHTPTALSHARLQQHSRELLQDPKRGGNKAVISDATSRKPARARPPPPRLTLPIEPYSPSAVQLCPPSFSKLSKLNTSPPPPSAFPSSLPPYLTLHRPQSGIHHAEFGSTGRKPSNRQPHRIPRQPCSRSHFFQGERITHVSPTPGTHPPISIPIHIANHNRTPPRTRRNKPMEDAAVHCTRTTAAACYRNWNWNWNWNWWACMPPPPRLGRSSVRSFLTSRVPNKEVTTLQSPNSPEVP